MTARDDIRAGDVGWTPGDIAIKARGCCTAMPWGTVCRVIKVRWGFDDDNVFCLGLTFAGWDPGVGYGQWAADNFDKLEPAKPCFTEAMQRLIEPAPAKPSIVAELRALNFGGW